MSSKLYAKILLTPYQKPTNPGNNKPYPTGVMQVAHKSIKDTWERKKFEFVTSTNYQHVIKKQIIMAGFA